MASPPFSISESLPGDSDIVSQHPVNARAFRDTVESWLLVNHNVQGRHDVIGLDVAATPSGVASVTKLWADTAGDLRSLYGASGVARYVGLPPGAIIDYAGATEPEGWLFPYGQAVSRTTYAVLFAVIGTAFGVGDGSTTFNLPDYRGRVGAGQDDMGGSSANRLTGLTGGVNGDTFAAVGGAEGHILTIAQLPVVTPSGTIVSTVTGGTQGGSASGFHQSEGVSTGPYTTTPITVTSTFTGTPFGSGTTHNNVQPTIIVNKLIKT